MQASNTYLKTAQKLHVEGKHPDYRTRILVGDLPPPLSDEVYIPRVGLLTNECLWYRSRPVII